MSIMLNIINTTIKLKYLYSNKNRLKLFNDSITIQSNHVSKTTTTRASK